MDAVAGSATTAVEAGLLLEAKAAPDSSRLGKTTVSERSVTAFDLTLSAPKSVRVLYTLDDARLVAAVEAAHTDAVLQSIESLSPRIAYTRTGHAEVAVVDAEGVWGIRYRHRTSRALDPQLHDHVLISNAVSDGEWRTMDARGLYRQAKAAGVEYQAHLRAGYAGRSVLSSARSMGTVRPTSSVSTTRCWQSLRRAVSTSRQNSRRGRADVGDEHWVRERCC